jgi:hypothetical protein
MHQKIIIDEEFKAILPALDRETYAMLEESLLSHGCMNPLVLWNGVLIDGHNRYEICKRHKIRFQTIDKEFGSREEALIWIITTQVARRNLSPMQLSYFRGLHYNADKRIQGTSNNHSEQSEKGQNDLFQKPQSTADRIAEQYNVSAKTIQRDAQLARTIDAIGANSADAKREILTGTAGITRQRLQELASGASEDEIKSIAESIEEGTYERAKRGAATEKDPEAVFHGVLEALNSAIDKMADEFELAVLRLKGEVGGEELRAVLRAHIDRLEGLCRRI